MEPCSFVKLQALIVMLEHFKGDELTTAPCWSLPNSMFLTRK